MLAIGLLTNVNRNCGPIIEGPNYLFDLKFKGYKAHNFLKHVNFAYNKLRCALRDEGGKY